MPAHCTCAASKLSYQLTPVYVYSLNSPLDDSMYDAHQMSSWCQHDVPKDSIQQLLPLPGGWEQAYQSCQLYMLRFDPSIDWSLRHQVSGPFCIKKQNPWCQLWQDAPACCMHTACMLCNIDHLRNDNASWNDNALEKDGATGLASCLCAASKIYAQCQTILLLWDVRLVQHLRMITMMRSLHAVCILYACYLHTVHILPGT